MATVNERIKELRRMENLTQVQFAEKLGVTNAHISKIEKGKTMPSEALVKLICSVFGVSEDWLKNENSQVYLNDIEYVQEKNFEKATRQHSHLLKTEDSKLRFKVSQLDTIIESIINVDALEQGDKIQYITMLTNLFELVRDTMNYIKEYQYDKDLGLMQEEIGDHISEQIEKIKKEIDDYSIYYLFSNWYKQ